jgi:hypothetical protein
LSSGSQRGKGPVVFFQCSKKVACAPHLPQKHVDDLPRPGRVKLCELGSSFCIICKVLKTYAKLIKYNERVRKSVKGVGQGWGR